ncbi:MAG: DUF222 domain-containing protein [Actinomycetota bacterium]|nr:DUF222 domain-containing protein [Actinomycetota bacterium]
MFANEVDFEVLTTEGEESPEPDRHLLPADLESIPPGPFLAAILFAVDRSRLNGYDLVRVLGADARMEACFASLKLESVTEVARTPACTPDGDVERDANQAEFADVEIAAELNLTRRSADVLIGLAAQVKSRHPQVWGLLHAGDIDVPRARAIVDSVSHLPMGPANEIVDRVVEGAPGLTTGQLKARMRRLCLEVDPEDAKKRYEEALTERRVETPQNPDGTANLFAYNLEPHVVAGIAGMLHETAKSLRSEDEVRTMDQLRADILVDVLLGNGAVDLRQASILVTVNGQTLDGTTVRAAEIAGMGPVIPEVVSQMLDSCADAEHQYVVIDDTGDVTGSGVIRRRPNRAQRRRIQSRNPTCTAPGCRMPAKDCDIDHTVAYSEGGPTTDCNLAPLCRYHHRAKHLAPWKVEKMPDGTFLWTSKHGHTYITSGRSP